MFALLACAVMLVFGCGSQGGYQDFSQDGRAVKAPDFDLRTLDGGRVTLSDFKGQVVFLDFWASWCPPCIQSAPEIVRLIDDYAGKPVAIVNISLDQSVEPARRFVDRFGITSIIAMAGNSDVAERYRVTGIPMFILLDQDGMLAGAWSGYHPSYPQQWRADIDRLLKA